VSRKVDISVRTGNVQLLEFTISGILQPIDLRDIQIVKTDPSKPLVLSGRAPQWFYVYLAHQYHFTRILATFEPRAGKGVIVSSVNDKDVGCGLDVETGEIRDVKLCANGKIDVSLIKLGSFQLLRAELVEGSFAEPSELRRIDWENLRKIVDQSKPIIAYVMAPIWIGAKISVEFSNLSPWVAVYDPKIESSIVVARHAPKAPEIGCQIELKIQEKKNTD
jgi:CRISPR-associated Csx3 family protein